MGLSAPAVYATVPAENTIGKLADRDRHVLMDLDEGSVGLRHVREDAQHVRARDAKERSRSPFCEPEEISCRAGVDAAVGDGIAVEGSDDLLEPL